MADESELAGTSFEHRCPNGLPNPQYRCRFCQVPLHYYQNTCGCAEIRKEVTLYGHLCHGCAGAIDMLMEDTVVGRVHKALVKESWFAGRGPSDD